MANSFLDYEFNDLKLGSKVKLEWVPGDSSPTTRGMQIVSRGRAHGNGFLNVIPAGCQPAAIIC
jgi:hypothetical protein